MNVSDLDYTLVAQYAAFARSFSSIRAAEISDQIAALYEQGKFWPAPLITINPRFEQGKTMSELSMEGVFDPALQDIFAFGSERTPIPTRRRSCLFTRRSATWVRAVPAKGPSNQPCLFGWLRQCTNIQIAIGGPASIDTRDVKLSEIRDISDAVGQEHVTLKIRFRPELSESKKTEMLLDYDMRVSNASIRVRRAALHCALRRFDLDTDPIARVSQEQMIVFLNPRAHLGEQ